MDPTLSTTTATATARDATPPLAGALRDGGFAALFALLAAQAAGAACTYYGVGAITEQCQAIGSTVATTMLSTVTGVLVGGFTGARKWVANRKVRQGR